MFVSLIILLLLRVAKGDKESPRDSYLDAYIESQGTTAKSDREFRDSYPYPAAQPSFQYGLPSGPPKYMYGPPTAPAYNYGPPVPVYGPPLPVQQPHGMLSLLDKFKLKLDLFTIGKILLKIVIFKKIVSFIAIICLLLFIPSLKHKVDEAVPEDDEEAMKNFKYEKHKSGADESLNYIANFVITAIDNFSKSYETNT